MQGVAPGPSQWDPKIEMNLYRRGFSNKANPKKICKNKNKKITPNPLNTEKYQQIELKRRHLDPSQISTLRKQVEQSTQLQTHSFIRKKKNGSESKTKNREDRVSSEASPTVQPA